MRFSSTAIVAAGFVAQQAAATWDLGATSFCTPDNTDNQCSPEQESGYSWGGLSTGGFSSYGGSSFSGFSCSDNFGKRDLLPRTFGGKCITGQISQDSGPSISCDHSFSIKDMQLSTDYDTDVDIEYGMEDGSTCKQTASCGSSGTTVSNSQCGGAKSVTFKIPSGGRSDCSIGVHSIGYHCGSASSSIPTQYQPTSVPVYSTPGCVGSDCGSYSTPGCVGSDCGSYSTPGCVGSNCGSYSTPGCVGSDCGSYSTTVGCVGSDCGSYSTPGCVGSDCDSYSTTAGCVGSDCGSYSTPGCVGDNCGTYSTPSAPVYSSQAGTGYSLPSVPVYTSSATGAGPTTYPVLSSPAAVVSSSYGTGYSSIDSTTVVVVTTVTTCPVGQTVTQGTSTSVLQTPSISTIYITSTSTVCTRCIAATQTTGAPAVSSVGYSVGVSSAAVVSTPAGYPSIVISSSLAAYASSSGAPAPGVSTSTGFPSIVISSSLAAYASSSGAPAPGVSTPAGYSSPVISSILATYASSSGAPAPSAPCPGLLPKCMNTWIWKISCKDNSDYDCYCKDAGFIQDVINCVSAHGADSTEVSKALSYLTGICAPYVPGNPVIITGCPSTVTLGPTPSGSSVPVISSQAAAFSSAPAISSYVPIDSTTEIVYTTVTTCPVGQTVTKGTSTSVLQTPSVSTIIVTSTSTVCTKCIAATQTTAVPVGSSAAGYSSPVISSLAAVVTSSAPVVSSYVPIDSTTEIVYTTVTTCPVGQTVTKGTSTTVLQTPSVSTVVITSTSTVCTKCIAATQTTAVPVESSLAAVYTSAPVVSSYVPIDSTTEVVYTTVTTCPVGHTVTKGTSTTVLQTPSVSTVVITSTSTVCTKCVSPPVTTPVPVSSYAAAVSTAPIDSTTEIVHTTVTTCPVGHTVTKGTSTTILQTPSVSTVVSTSTSTVCTKCVAPPTTAPATYVTPVVTAAPSSYTAPVAVSSYAAAGFTSSAPAATIPLTTLSIHTTVTVPCTESTGISAGYTIPGSSTTTEIHTTVTVPQVAFTTYTVSGAGTTSTVSVGLVQTTPVAVSASETMAAGYTAPAAYSTFATGTVSVKATGAGATSYSSPPPFTGAAPTMGAGQIGSGAVFGIIAYFLL